MSEAPAVIVPSFDGAHLLGPLLDSLRMQTLVPQTIVADNGSSDATATLLATSFPEVRRLELEANLGFGRAANRAVAACDAARVIVVNNDVVCGPRFVERLCAALGSDGRTVMAAGVLLDAGSPGTIDTAGIVFDRTLFAADHLSGEPVEVLDESVRDPLGPSGGAAAFDRAAFDAVGGFDERIFAYLEDVDLVARLRLRGGTCRLARDARAVHRHSATLGSGSRRKNELMGWSRGYTIGKYRLHRRPGLLARATTAELVIAAGQLAVDRTWVGFPARLRGFRAGLEGPPQTLPHLPAADEPSFTDLLRRRARERRRRDQGGSQS